MIQRQALEVHVSGLKSASPSLRDRSFLLRPLVLIFFLLFGLHECSHHSHFVVISHVQQ